MHHTSGANAVSKTSCPNQPRNTVFKQSMINLWSLLLQDTVEAKRSTGFRKKSNEAHMKKNEQPRQTQGRILKGIRDEHPHIEECNPNH